MFISQHVPQHETCVSRTSLSPMSFIVLIIVTSKVIQTAILTKGVSV